GDIGKLAVCGTINDLVMQGANPEYISLALIIEEGLKFDVLERIIDSISFNAKKAGVLIVTGDLKVVEKGSCDKIFINTSGLGRIVKNKNLSFKKIRPKDKIIITGEIALHGLSVVTQRQDLNLGFNIKSDTQALNGLILPILKKINSIKFMRDPTRGGVATTLNEIAEGSNLGIVIEEAKIPLSSRAKAACELLGIDPLYIANEGCAIMIVEEDDAQKILHLLKKNPLGKNSQVIGEITDKTKKVILNTVVGGRRIVDMLSGQPLPRIC
ncbi:MAG: hydrogenase expression/formation protein HypE, partial [Candidatus Omnitrophica bacterium]|nr:hydrogenase expression/formation protein HypE [Candidatus Omnitrophota bacterium]